MKTYEKIEKIYNTIKVHNEGDTSYAVCRLGDVIYHLEQNDNDFTREKKASDIIGYIDYQSLPLQINYWSPSDIDFIYNLIFKEDENNNN